MQFQYQGVFTPLLPPTALPIIVEPCFVDWIEPPAPVEIGFQYYNPVAFAEYDGVTYFDDNSLPISIAVLEQYESFGVTFVPAVVVAPTAFGFNGPSLVDISFDAPRFESFAPTFFTPPSTFVKNWNYEHVDYVEPPVDYSDIQSVFECRRPLPVPGASVNLSLIEYYNLTVRLDVKKAVDSGVVVAVSTDVSGTPVLFNKAFKDVDSVVATVQEVANFQVVVDFVDVPNPTGFSVYVFNAAGTRVTKTVYWVARGII